MGSNMVKLCSGFTGSKCPPFSGHFLLYKCYAKIPSAIFSINKNTASILPCFMVSNNCPIP